MANNGWKYPNLKALEKSCDIYYRIVSQGQIFVNIGLNLVYLKQAEHTQKSVDVSDTVDKFPDVDIEKNDKSIVSNAKVAVIL